MTAAKPPSHAIFVPGGEPVTPPAAAPSSPTKLKIGWRAALLLGGFGLLLLTLGGLWLGTSDSDTGDVESGAPLSSSGASSGGSTAAPTSTTTPASEAPTAAPRPLQDALDAPFLSGTAIPFSLQFSGGVCPQYPNSYEQPATLEADVAQGTMTLRQAQHSPTGSYPTNASTVLTQIGEEPEVYEFTFSLDGQEVLFSGVYTFDNTCTWNVTGRPS